MLNLSEAREWLEILHGDSKGLINICSTLDWRGQFFVATVETHAALDYIQKLDDRGAEGIYLRATTLKYLPETGRGGDELSRMFPGVWADLDLAGPGHKSKGTLPPTVEVAMRIIAESGLPEPSHWIHSGGGLYPWWLLRQAAEIDDIETFRALSSGWQKAIERASLKMGYAYGSGVGDLSRVLRIPGTVNRKAGLERPCTALEGHAWSGPVYELSELLEALEAATPPPPAPTKLEIKQTTVDGVRPGDDFNQKMDWQSLLLPLGWQWVYKRGDKWHLRRPGKTSGTSATLSDITGNLYVFSEECHPLQSFQHYSKFHFYALTEHGGNHSAAAKALGAKGFGSPLERTAPSAAHLLLDSAQAMETSPTDLGTPGQAVPHTEAGHPSTPVGWREDFPAPQLTPQDFLDEEFTLQGAGNLFAKGYENAFKYCEDTKKWWFWSGKVWRLDGRARHEQATKELINVGRRAANAANLSGEDYGKPLTRHINKMANAQAPNVHRWARSDQRIGIDCEQLDAIGHMVTVGNGILDLESHTLMPHDPQMLLTRQIPVTYDKDALAPKWEMFLAQALPDPEIRAYLQKAIGHTMLGNAEQRALFLLHGPSGTGKSQFIRVMELLFGDFAETATAATFNASSKTATLTNDLNDLRGKRFVSLSELDEGEVLNESLVKRLTGGDTAKSRGLWQENSKWRVEFSMWLATNNLPRLNSDDNAIWRRVKPIEFGQVAAANGGEILRLAEKIFAEEASGILNWVLEGVRMYQQDGLADLDQITEAVNAYRREVDVVEQFIAQASDDKQIAVGEGQEIASSRLYAIFTEWCHANGMRNVFGTRRFAQRMERMGFEKKKTMAANVWVGIGTGNMGLLGTMDYPRRT